MMQNPNHENMVQPAYEANMMQPYYNANMMQPAYNASMMQPAYNASMMQPYCGPNMMQNPYVQCLPMPKLAHAYVPFQCLTCIFPPMKGLDAGTIFPELYRPYGVDPEYLVDA